MTVKKRRFTPRMSLLTRFSLVGLLLTAVIAVVVAWGIQRHLEDNTLLQEADNAADWVSVVLNPLLAKSDLSKPLDYATMSRLNAAVRQSIVGQHIVRVKLWGRDGTLLFSDAQSLVGRRFPITKELQRALGGSVATDFSNLQRAENVAERGRFSRLMEVYIPIRPGNSSEIAGAYEVYHDLSILDDHIARLRRVVWLSVGGSFLVLYVALFGLVRSASRQLVEAMGKLERQSHRMEELANATIEAQERERQYLSAEIHDDLLQGLVATSFFLQSLDGPSMDGKTKTRRQKLVDVVTASIDRGRSLISEIRPLHDQETTLLQAIEKSIELNLGDGSVHVDFRHPESLPEMDQATQTNVLRIVQEALMNIRKHAKASEVVVEIAVDDGWLTVDVTDNGVGYNTGGVSRSIVGHYGLLTMQQRARLAGGTCEINSHPGKGTSLRCTFPLRHHDPVHSPSTTT